MALTQRKRGSFRYTHSIRVDGRVTSQYLGTGEKGRLAHEAILANRARLKKMVEDHALHNAMMDLAEQRIKDKSEELAVANGMVCRRSVWVPIDRLRKPLTAEEKRHIAAVKLRARMDDELGATFLNRQLQNEI